MDDWDEISRQIQGRIDYENRQRHHEYNKRLAEYNLKLEHDRYFLSDSRGEGLGVRVHHEQLRKELDKEYEQLRAIDYKRQQGYWDALVEGKYVHPPADKERAEKLEQAEKSLTYKIERVKETGIKVNKDEWKAMEDMYGKDVMQLAQDNVDRRLTEERKVEAERMERIRADKQAAHNAELKRQEQERQQQKKSVFDLAEEEITRQWKRRI